jgi:hypothetical protein
MPAPTTQIFISLISYLECEDIAGVDQLGTKGSTTKEGFLFVVYYYANAKKYVGRSSMLMLSKYRNLGDDPRSSK